MNTKRIGILVVHGVGEQANFEFLEDVASNLYKALAADPQRGAYVQIRRGDQIPWHSPSESWRQMPVSVLWRNPNATPEDSNEWIEAHFREVHWADLDMPIGVRTWFALVGWALSASGVRLFKNSPVWVQRRPFMCLPQALTFWQRLSVRLQLLGVSLLFLLMLLTVDLIYGLLTRFSFRAEVLRKIRLTIYDYLGDVKLYQDWFVRDDRLETIGEKSRVAIRRRMVRALLDMAAQVKAGQLHGYYIFAHSLGTVVAFNGLMELSLTLPNYFTEEEWDTHRPVFGQEAPGPAPPNQMPRRPPWLRPRDAINRSRIFEGFRGFLTMGSPLDKFAALWPVIVPINREAIAGDKPWINVADRQDIVAGSIDLFPPCDPAPGVGGLRLVNVNWADRLWPLSAHTSYWKVGRTHDRLINRIILWLEGAPFQAPRARYSPWLARPLFLLWTLGPSFLLLTILAWVVQTIFSEPGCTSILPVLCISSFSFWQTLGGLVFPAILAVLVCSIVRRLWEEFYLGRWERHFAPESKPMGGDV